MCCLRHAMWPQPKEKEQFIIKVYDIKKKQGKKGTGGGLEKADLSAKDKRTVAITGETAQLRGIPPRKKGNSDARTFSEQYFSFFKNPHRRPFQTTVLNN